MLCGASLGLGYLDQKIIFQQGGLIDLWRDKKEKTKFDISQHHI